MKTFSINERLKIDKNTKSIKLLIDVEAGDTIYFHNPDYSSDTDRKLNKYCIYNLTVTEVLIDPNDKDYIRITGKVLIMLYYDLEVFALKLKI